MKKITMNLNKQELQTLLKVTLAELKTIEPSDIENPKLFTLAFMLEHIHALAYSVINEKAIVVFSVYTNRDREEIEKLMIKYLQYADDVETTKTLSRILYTLTSNEIDDLD